jgi:sugar/nucleoside kinase (ribokinase family)
MNAKKEEPMLRISGTGCSLVDYLYANMKFNDPAFTRYLSARDGDGGLSPGKLVFAEDFEVFAGKPFSQVLAELTPGKKPDKLNLGGPAIVALVNTAQLLAGRKAEISFHGVLGNDETGDALLSFLAPTPVKTDHYRRIPGISPSTVVFSDPTYDGGHGERIFVNTVGAAWKFKEEDLDASFFDSDLLLFGATGLVPLIHDSLSSLVTRGKSLGKITVVTTVYDFRNQKKDPVGPWPLGSDTEKTLAHTDLLIADHEEALRISGTSSMEKAAEFYKKSGVGALIVTHGAKETYIYSKGSLFAPVDFTTVPVVHQVDEELKNHPERKGDTTGCGDNFAGGVLYSLADQLIEKKPGKLDLIKASAWGSCSGGFACFYIGGTYHEKERCEKLKRMLPYFESYKKQISHRFTID